MRTINKTDIGKNLLLLLNEEEPIDEDIKILDENGEVTAAILTKEAYQFFLRKIEEEEDKVDNKTVEDFHQSGEMSDKK